nr:alpha/beta hydrolase [Herbaspirillum sp. AP02]
MQACLWGVPKPDRPTIVLMHESLGGLALWRDFPAQLSARLGCAVVAYDRYGFGHSAARHDRLSADFIATEARPWLAAVLQQLELAKVVLFGHSVGGGMAISAAPQLPRQVVAVITESAQAFVEERTLQGIRAARDNFADPAQVLRLAKYHGNDLQKARWVLDAWIDTWLDPGFADWSLDAALACVQCPILALHGDRDEFGSLAHPHRIAGPTGEVGAARECLVLSQCGHVPHREQPEQVLQAVSDFLQRRVWGCSSLRV